MKSNGEKKQKNMQAQMSKEDKANKQLPDSKCTKEAEKPSKKVSTTPAAKSPSPLPNSPMEKKGKNSESGQHASAAQDKQDKAGNEAG